MLILVLVARVELSPTEIEQGFALVKLSCHLTPTSKTKRFEDLMLTAQVGSGRRNDIRGDPNSGSRSYSLM